MDVRTGKIQELEAFKGVLSSKEQERYLKEVRFRNLSRGIQRQLMKTGVAKVGRNQKCSCGSGKKFKKCCLRDND